MAKSDNKESPAAAGVAARAKAKDEQNADYYARQEGLQPTPTQAENDLAKVGALNPDDKEDDGSEWDADHQRRVMEAKLPGGNPYETRADAPAATATGGESRRSRAKPE